MTIDFLLAIVIPEQQKPTQDWHSLFVSPQLFVALESKMLLLSVFNINEFIFFLLQCHPAIVHLSASNRMQRA